MAKSSSDNAKAAAKATTSVKKNTPPPKTRTREQIEYAERLDNANGGGH